LPGIVTLLAFGIYPVIYALWASLHKVDLAMLAAGTPFNGGQNYISAFFNSLFTGAVARSLVFLAISLPFELGFGVLLALYLHGTVFPKLLGVVRVILVIPMAMTPVVVGLSDRALSLQGPARRLVLVHQQLHDDDPRDPDHPVLPDRAHPGPDQFAGHARARRSNLRGPAGGLADRRSIQFGPQSARRSGDDRRCRRGDDLLSHHGPVGDPGIAVAAILSMIFSWNELLYAMILTPSDETRTAPVTALSFLGGYATPWGDLMAAGSLIVLPVIVFAVLVSRYLVRGLTLGAVK
jgi:ABC-type spermidine/putrescine transport system permease subunit II